LSSSGGASLLLRAAKRLEPLNLDLARETYVNAWMAALFAGHLARAGEILEISRAARALPPPTQPARPLDLLLDGFALLVTDGPAAAAPTLREAASAFASADTAREEVLQFGWVASTAANTLWDEESFRAILVRQVQLARAVGALEQLPLALVGLAMDDAWRGDFTGADSLIAEIDAVCEATGGTPIAPFAASFVAALRGNQAETIPLVEATITTAEAMGQGAVVTYAHWVTAISNNGLGRYTDALTAADRATRDAHPFPVSDWAGPELIEAAVRSGNTALAVGALDRLAETAQAGRTDFGLGLEARCRALLSSGDAAEALYREAIGRLGRTRLRPDLARAHLLYGEWLRRQGQRTGAREQLRTAHGMLAAIGMEAFAERAWRELIATGEKMPKRSVETRGRLAPQEEQIARLARDGRTTPEISGQLFLSARTVEWHLRKIFTKLGICSRRELDDALAHRERDDQPN
jgi:DNA-binding CsgD family transcriptional regulator